MKILVAEDEPGVRRSMVRMLNTLGYGDIREAGNGSEALRLVQKACPEVIIADIKMPGMDGLELLTRATFISDEIKCIFVSGFDYFEYAQKAISLGASGYLLKPVKETELRALLDKIAAKITQNNKARVLPPDTSELGSYRYDGRETDHAFDTAWAGKNSVLAGAAAKDLLRIFQSGDKNAADLLVDELLLPFSQTDFLEQNQLSKMDFQFLLQIYKALFQFGISGEKLIGKEFLLYKRLNGCKDVQSTIQMFKEILSVCFDSIAASRKKPANRQIEKAKEYISNNYAKDITQLDVAEYVHLNMSYFSRLFKQESGENFVDYLRNYRLNKAIELLKEGFFKSNEVSHMVGFSNEKYFYKIFKQKTGFTPSEIRNI